MPFHRMVETGRRSGGVPIFFKKIDMKIIFLTEEEIKNLPNDCDLGEYVRNKINEED